MGDSKETVNKDDEQEIVDKPEITVKNMSTPSILKRKKEDESNIEANEPSTSSAKKSKISKSESDSLEFLSDFKDLIPEFVNTGNFCINQIKFVPLGTNVKLTSPVCDVVVMDKNLDFAMLTSWGETAMNMSKLEENQVLFLDNFMWTYNPSHKKYNSVISSDYCMSIVENTQFSINKEKTEQMKAFLSTQTNHLTLSKDLNAAMIVLQYSYYRQKTYTQKDTGKIGHVYVATFLTGDGELVEVSTFNDEKKGILEALEKDKVYIIKHVVEAGQSQIGTKRFTIGKNSSLTLCEIEPSQTSSYIKATLAELKNSNCIGKHIEYAGVVVESAKKCSPHMYQTLVADQNNVGYCAIMRYTDNIELTAGDVVSVKGQIEHFYGRNIIMVDAGKLTMKGKISVATPARKDFF